MSFVFSYNNKQYKKICKFKIIKKIDNQWHPKDRPVSIFISQINNKYVVIKKVNLNKLNKIIYYNQNFPDIYRYIYNNLNKNLLKHLYKIYYIYNCKHIQYNIIKYYKYNLSEYNNRLIRTDYKNILLNINIFLFNLNNILHIYHNDIYVYIYPNVILLNNIMYYKTKINKENIYKLHNVTIKNKIINYIPVLIDFDNADTKMIDRHDINNINKHMFDNKITFDSEILYFNTCYIIKYIYNQEWFKSKKFNKTKIILYVTKNILYIQDHIISKYNIKSKIEFESYFIKYIDKHFIKLVKYT